MLVGASIRSHGWRSPPFQAAVASEAVKQVVSTDTAEARKLGVTGAPAFFVNGRFLRGAQPFDAFETLVDEELGKTG